MVRVTDGASRSRSALALAGFLSLCLGAGGLGGLFTSRSLEEWYPALVKPGWNPPDFVFAPVWTTLFVLIGIAGWLIWRAPPHPSRRRALVFFATQLLLNSLWSMLFFGLESPGLALVEIAFLWLAILLTMVSALTLSRTAGWLLASYLAWVSFAVVLNTAIWRLNG